MKRNLPLSIKVREWYQRQKFKFYMWYGKRTWLQNGERTLSFKNHTCTFSVKSNASLIELQMMAQTETRFMNELLTELQPDDVFVDIGANIGVVSCFASKEIDDTGQIFAVEPYSPNIPRLKENLQRNNCTNVKQLDIAFGDENTELQMDGGKTVDGAASINSKPRTLNDYIVDMFTGDDYFDARSSFTPTVLKIDVEGAEGLVIDGFTNILQDDDFRAVFIEIHHNTDSANRDSIEDYGWTPQELYNYLEDLGFTIETIWERTEESHIVARK